MLSRIRSCAVYGLDAYTIDVEVDIARGLPMFSLVGLPDTSVREAKDRVTSAIRNSGFDFPSRKITVNLAPADIKKEGASFDLPIALGILCANQKVAQANMEPYCFVGELALDGSVRPIKGTLQIVLQLKSQGIENVVVPKANVDEARVIAGIRIFPVDNLAQLVRFLTHEEDIVQAQPMPYSLHDEPLSSDEDISEIKGHAFAKRAIEVASAGGHNILMIGPPGSGKTMIAKRVPGILPRLAFEEAIESTKIHSVSSSFQRLTGLMKQRPFRSPHHTISPVAMIGGGTYPKPGEVSLAHNGVLFLDEFSEFHRDVLEVLRQPLEEGSVTVSRAKNTLRFPARFMLVAAMNPCPCGNFGHPEKECLCTPYQIRKYRAKISEPLLDRIDMHLEIPALKIAEFREETKSGVTSAEIRSRVIRARSKQKNRFKNGIYCNSQMNSKDVRAYCALGTQGKDLLFSAIERLHLSARAYDRILKVSRTIADLDDTEEIMPMHVAEAIQYRTFDRMV